MDKTNAMRTLDRAKLNYKAYTFDAKEALSGIEVAKILEKDEKTMFKTLVTVGKSGNHYVFMIPVAEELDLKKAAKAASEKSIEMIKSKELLPLTGYIHGGCSPIGMKKQFKTFLHQTAENLDIIIFSAGKIGAQIEMNPNDLKNLIRIELADLTC